MSEHWPSELGSTATTIFIRPEQVDIALAMISLISAENIVLQFLMKKKQRCHIPAPPVVKRYLKLSYADRISRSIGAARVDEPRDHFRQFTAPVDWGSEKCRQANKLQQEFCSAKLAVERSANGTIATSKPERYVYSTHPRVLTNNLSSTNEKVSKCRNCDESGHEYPKPSD